MVLCQKAYVIEIENLKMEIQILRIENKCLLSEVKNEVVTPKPSFALVVKRNIKSRSQKEIWRRYLKSCGKRTEASLEERGTRDEQCGWKGKNHCLGANTTGKPIVLQEHIQGIFFAYESLKVNMGKILIATELHTNLVWSLFSWCTHQWSTP